MDQPLPLAPGVVPTAVLGEQSICRNDFELSETTAKWVVVNHSQCDLDHTQVTGYYTQLGSCHGPAGGGPAAGAGRRVPAERIPRATPPNLAAGRDSK
jgi:hypothetical protein